MKRRRITIPLIEEYIQEHNISAKIVSTEYNNAHEKLIFLCKCGKEYERNWNNFRNRKQYLCYECGRQKAAETKTKTNEEFINEVESKYPGTYKILSPYIQNKVHILVEHISCGHQYKVMPINLLRDRGCPNCIVPNRDRDTELAKKQVHDITNGEYELVGEYIHSQTHALFRHNKCGYEWFSLPNNFFSHNRRCPKCALENQTLQQRKSHNEFLGQLKEKYGEEYTVLSEYVRSVETIRIKHNECGHEWNIHPGNLLKRKVCPKCRFSKGEVKVEEWLTDNEIAFKPQYKFDDCRHIRALTFDFFLPSYNTIIEYDGEQHFKPARFSKDKDRMQKKLEEVQYRDKIKNQYCKDKGIKLIRIPYTEYQNIDNILSACL